MQLEEITYLDSDLASWKYKKIYEQVKEFESKLGPEFDTLLVFASNPSFGAVQIDSMSFQNPDLIYFYGTIEDNPVQIIQHVSQINLLITSLKRVEERPPRRIGFIAPLSE